MAGKIFDQIPWEYVRLLIEKNPDGGRFRIPPLISSHNPIHVKKRNSQICRMRQEGRLTSEIADAIGLTTRTVQMILKENGLSRPAEKKKSRLEQLNELLASGDSRKSIADKLGISRARLYQIMKDEGLK